MILTLGAIVAAYLYVLALAWRVGHTGKHGRVWSTPRPARLLQHGSHARPRKPAPHSEPEAATDEAAGLAVAA
ncbi:hypothetical protein [Actinomadura sp. WMMA1423]|uniref:hypothetical protein n=1 Tax=Actinomadura sp. WMMA1423 TaxID=2591108 RepID=UPI00114696DC|nr:hypothetical protein [Actinomadura sp. WMMA1423]